MDRDKIKFYLYSYNKLHGMIEESKKKIDEYNTTIKVIENTYAAVGASVMDGLPRSSSVFSDKILNQINKKDREIENVKRLIYRESKKIEEYILMYSVISKVLQDSDNRVRDLVKNYYFEEKTMIETCYFINYSTSTFKRLNNNLISRIQKEMDTD